MRRSFAMLMNMPEPGISSCEPPSDCKDVAATSTFGHAISAPHLGHGTAVQDTHDPHCDSAVVEKGQQPETTDCGSTCSDNSCQPEPHGIVEPDDDAVSILNNQASTTYAAEHKQTGLLLQEEPPQVDVDNDAKNHVSDTTRSYQPQTRPKSFTSSVPPFGENRKQRRKQKSYHGLQRPENKQLGAETRMLLTNNSDDATDIFSSTERDMPKQIVASAKPLITLTEKTDRRSTETAQPRIGSAYMHEGQIDAKVPSAGDKANKMSGVGTTKANQVVEAASSIINQEYQDTQQDQTATSAGDNERYDQDDEQPPSAVDSHAEDTVSTGHRTRAYPSSESARDTGLHRVTKKRQQVKPQTTKLQAIENVMSNHTNASRRSEEVLKFLRWTLQQEEVANMQAAASMSEQQEKEIKYLRDAALTKQSKSETLAKNNATLNEQLRHANERLAAFRERSTKLLGSINQLGTDMQVLREQGTTINQTCHEFRLQDKTRSKERAELQGFFQACVATSSKLKERVSLACREAKTGITIIEEAKAHLQQQLEEKQQTLQEQNAKIGLLEKQLLESQRAHDELKCRLDEHVDNVMTKISAVHETALGMKNEQIHGQELRSLQAMVECLQSRSAATPGDLEKLETIVQTLPER